MEGLHMFSLWEREEAWVLSHDGGSLCDDESAHSCLVIVTGIPYYSSNHRDWMIQNRRDLDRSSIGLKRGIEVDGDGGLWVW